jgi:putative endonuclease
VTQTTRDQGVITELACCKYLQAQGLVLLARNYRSKLGEIDLIMLDKKTLVFVEVRFRKDQRYGGPLASVTAHKQQRIRATAEHYLQQQSSYNAARIDVVGMSWLNPDTAHKVGNYSFEWIKNAF